MDEFEKWFDALNAKHDFLVWKKLAHRDTALEAWNAALAIGEARGRVLGMGAAAGIAEGIKSEFSTGCEEWDDACEQIVKAIRQAAAQPVDHIVEPHALVGKDHAEDVLGMVVSALREMSALWERVHGGAILGRPTVNAAKRAIKAFDAAQPAEVCCEWIQPIGHGYDWYVTGCDGTSLEWYPLMEKCLRCGKLIKVKGE